MIYWELFLGFLRVGCFSFGGAYSAIPLIRDIVMSYGWLTEDQLAYMIAVSESTPGPIMVNLATYVGSSQAGILGAALATLTVILPAFVIILLVMAVLKNALKHPCVQAVIGGLQPCIIGIILATGIYMTAKDLVPGGSVDVRAVIIAVLLAFLMFGPKKIVKKRPSAIMMIVISAVCGILLYSI